MSGLYISKAENKQKDFTKLINMQGKSLFDKNDLNILKDKDRRKKIRLNRRSGNKKAKIL